MATFSGRASTRNGLGLKGKGEGVETELGQDGEEARAARADRRRLVGVTAPLAALPLVGAVVG